MKRTGTRLIVIVLLFALLTAPAQGGNTQARHMTATALSAQAQTYYAGPFRFQLLCSMPGKSGAPENAMRSDLFLTLHDLMSATMTRSYSYASLPQYWASTDAAGTNGALYFYSDIPGGGQLTREHVWAKSHGTFYESGAGSDLHHLRPEDSSINSTRSNFTFGNVRNRLFSYRTASLSGREVLWYDAGYFDHGCNGLVEVPDNVKGDVARILLYVYVTYSQPNLTNNTTATGEGNLRSDGRKVIESLDTLLDWCRMDPVDTWEMRRNDCVQALQGNRNVFIDYPELAWLLFDRTIPNMPTPSGYARQNQGSGFLDVPKNAWYLPGVDYAVANGLMNGVGHGRFAPEQTLTRAQLATIVFRLEGSPELGGVQNHFSDVPGNTWYTKAVIWASVKNIMLGYGDGRFHPDEPIPREQLVTVLYRYVGAEPGNASAIASFPDHTAVSAFARDAMGWAVSQGLINGTPTNQGVLLSPQSATTRAQSSVIMQRFLQEY